MTQPVVVQYVLHPDVRRDLEAWLRGRGLVLSAIGDGTCESYAVSPSADAYHSGRAAQRTEPERLFHRPKPLRAPLPLFETIGTHSCAGCTHPAVQHLAVGGVVSCSMCECVARLVA